MNQSLVSILAFSGGVFLAIQAGFNSQLGVLLKKPLLAAISTSVSSAVFALLFILLFTKEIPNLHTAKQVPWYLWCIGGLFSVIGISLYYYTIPKLGISRMMSLGLCGQLIFSLAASHYGWMNLPLEPTTIKKGIGVTVMIIGIICINSK
ncbi:DMT family transporter [Flavobacterium sp.]|uniref:DMT family transporter n=1 Tax=Flavobacterium sp. TaxID=239 RepID=UPI003D6BACC9